MDEQENDIDLLDRYLNNTLSLKEKTAVEERIEGDEVFAALYRDMKVLLAGVKQESQKDLIASLRKIEDGLPEVKLSKTRKLNTTTAVALAIAASVLLAAVIFFTPKSKPDLAEATFREFFVPYPNVVDPATRGQVASDSSQNAFTFYNNSKFDSAAIVFELTEQKNATIYFYLGNAYLATGRAADAIRNLQLCVDEGDVFAEQAEWYLSLAYLKNNEKDLATTLLRSIREKGGSYMPKAKELLNKLE